MPKLSEREVFLAEIVDVLAAAVLELQDDEDLADSTEGEDSDDVEVASDSDEAGSGVDELFDLLCAVDSSRYLGDRRRFAKARDFGLSFFANLPPREFRQIARMSKESFERVVSLIKSHSVFANKSRYKQAPVWFQLAVTLDRFGNYGNGASLGRTFKLWGIGKGTVDLFTCRVETALCDLASTFVK